MYSEWASDEIHIEKLEVFAHHGVYPKETRDGQNFYVNAVLYVDAQKAGREDDLEKSVDYGEVCSFISNWMQEHTCLLLEAVAEGLSREILLKYKSISKLDLEIQKPNAPIPLPFGNVSVKVHRGWHRAYLAVGSNIGDRESYIAGAVSALRTHPLMVVNKVSDMILTEPYGNVNQEKFLNGVLEIETLLSPEELLEALHEIEDSAGRKRTIHWGPRTLDLDILFYDRLCYESDTLIIPHPDMENRSFVLEPLAMIAPNARHPISGKRVNDMLREYRIRQGKN